MQPPLLLCPRSEGSIKAGDRLVGVDGRDLTRMGLTEAQEALRGVERQASLTLEYVWA